MHQLRAYSANGQRLGEQNQCHITTNFPGLQNDSMDVDEPDLGKSPLIVLDEPTVNFESIDDSSIEDCSTTSDIQIVQGPTARLENGEVDPLPGQSRRPRPNDPPSPLYGMRRRRRVEIVDLVDSPVPPSASTTCQTSNEWACPVCTLYNLVSAQQCDACNGPNPDRTLGSTETERLIDTSASPLAVGGGGASMGSFLGVAGSFIHGRDPLVFAMEGGVTGAFGGAFLNEAVPSRRFLASVSVYRNENGTNPNCMGLAQARTSGGMTGGYPSIGGDLSENTNGRSRPRSSFRVESTRDQDGSTVSVVMGGRSSTTIRQSQTPIGLNDRMRDYLLHAMLEEHTLRDDNVDGMGYEELLQAFGDGTENLGASEEQIESLLNHLVHDPKRELPEDARRCLICLDEIEKGNIRKILPCVHGFHNHCCDKWLRTNGSCPICKHRI